MDRAAAEQQQGQQCDHDREARVDRPAERLQDRMVDDQIERLSGVARLVLSDSVVDDDRVVNAEADDRQHRRDEECVDLHPEQRAQDGEDTDDHDHVVEQSDEGGGAELDALEADTDPSQDADRTDEDEQDRRLDQLAADHRADRRRLAGAGDRAELGISLKDHRDLRERSFRGELEVARFAVLADPSQDGRRRR